MQIFINGQSRAAPDEVTIEQLLNELGLQARHVAVEVNLELMPRAQHAQCRLAEGDRLEVVTLVGGG